MKSSTGNIKREIAPEPDSRNYYSVSSVYLERKLISQLKNQTFNELLKTAFHSMNTNIPFQAIDWSSIPKKEHKGETGTAFWQTVQFPGLRIRMVEYTAGYLADHWCRKGHIVHCLEGEFVSESEDGNHSVFKKGMTYIVSDELSLHRSETGNGVKLLIIDGDFLKFQESF